MKYDKVRYLELLKQAENIKKKGLSLYKENRDMYLELLKYEVRLSDQTFWENRKNYFSIMNDLLNEKLTAEDFVDEFMYLWEKDRDTVIVNYDPNIESKGFARWIDRIFFPCEDFEPEAQKNEPNGEQCLKDSIRDILIDMQKKYNSDKNAD